jgi:hypothetical protein
MLSNVTKLLAVTALVGVTSFATTAEAAKRPRNVAPIISGTPITSVNTGSLYNFVAVATDANGDALTYQIVGKPAWATFYTSTGKLSGTPTTAHVGTYANIVISVSDGRFLKSLPAFAITVNAVVVNRAPTISGTPVTAGTAGQPYAFRPTATDLDGNALTFSIANKPAWATFDATTGTLYGTPTAANSTSNVTISFSDGKVSASLAPFSINILPAPLALATLSWTPPTQNTDGTTINNLTGYKVSYGNATRTYSVELTISGAATNSVVIEDLQPGAYYFAVKAVNANGVVSDFSNEVSKVL